MKNAFVIATVAFDEIEGKFPLLWQRPYLVLIL
jgi:hypothetical protein